MHEYSTREKKGHDKTKYFEHVNVLQGLSKKPTRSEERNSNSSLGLITTATTDMLMQRLPPLRRR